MYHLEAREGGTGSGKLYVAIERGTSEGDKWAKIANEHMKKDTKRRQEVEKQHQHLHVFCFNVIKCRC